VSAAKGQRCKNVNRSPFTERGKKGEESAQIPLKGVFFNANTLKCAILSNILYFLKELMNASVGL